ncbi:MAG: TraM recognition domain-containing protein [Bradyrhizobium sp.]|nr:TraM recognition domain-containing protein [Bradyrhizobium sp.]
MLRYAGAPQQIAVALRFMLDEARLARRYVMPALLTLLTSVLFWVLAHWPQFGLAAGWRDGFAIFGVCSLLMLVLAPLIQRGHWINTLHLRALMAQQVRHSSFVPVTMRMAAKRLRALLGPAVFKLGETVVAGGFPWQWGDFTKGLMVTGQPGSGKTTTVLNALLDGFFLMFAGRGGFSALIQDVQGDFGGKIERLCKTHGRSADLVIFDIQADPAQAGASNAAIFNPIDSKDPAAEIAAALQAASKHLGVTHTDSYFIDAFRMLVTFGIVLLRAGLPEGAVPSIIDLHRLLSELNAYADKDQKARDTSRPILYEQLTKRILKRWPDPDQMPAEVDDAGLYIEQEFLPMPHRQRAGIMGTVSQLFGELMAEPVRHFLTGKSTISMQDVLEQGKIYYVHAPLAANPRLGLIVNTVIKRQFQNAVLRSREKPVPSIYLCDEFHNLFSPGRDGDSQFFSLSRQANHANLIAFQNLPLLQQVAKTKAEVMSLLGNCATKIFLRNTDPETNDFGSSLFGEVVGISVTQSAPADLNGLLRRSARTNYSRSTSKSRVVPPEAFAKLAVPVNGDPERNYAQAIVHLATRGETERLDLIWKLHPL